MSKFSRILTLAIFMGILVGCTRPVPGNNPGTNPGSGATGGLLGIETPDLQLSVLVSNSGDTFNTVGQVINYSFTLQNASTNTKYDGPVTITDDKAGVANCPALNTVGPTLDDNLDPGESITCTGTYSITQADLDAGKVTDSAQAIVAGGASSSNQASAGDVMMKQTKALILATTADKTTYDQVGQVITFNYVITNSGNVTLGPAQFTVSDSLIVSPVNCSPAGSILQPGGSINCSAPHTVTQADLNANSMTSNAIASDDTTTSYPFVLTVTKSNTPQPPASGLTPGTTVQHTVIPGDWLMQIARCYGADYKSVRRANPQIWNPAMIWAGQVVSVPNIGSVGPIYDKPCVVFHIAVAGDTWESIAQQYNARVDILKRVNPGSLFPGANIKVPINSAGGSSTQVPVTKRINFPAGVTSVMENGTLTMFGKITYLVAGKKDQTMTVTLTAPAGEVAMGIYDPSGAMLLNPADLAQTWNGVVPTNGDYRIELASAAGITDKNYSLKVELTSPGESAPDTKRINVVAGTPATETGTLTANGKITYLVAASQGQTMTVTLAEPAGEITLGIYDPNGTTLFNQRVPGGWGEGATWTGILPTGGDYRIELASTAGVTDQDYSLRVDIATPVGTLERVTNIRGGSDFPGAFPRFPAVYNGTLYFDANEEDGSYRGLWKYDGSSVSLVAGDLGEGPKFLTEFNGALYFSADNGEGAGRELWKYDGAAPPSLVYDIRKGPESSYPGYLTVYNGELYFTADDGEGTGYELWKYDGTNPPTLVEDIWDGPESSDPNDLAVYTGELYFSADDGESAGEELWKYDGTSPSSLVEDIWDGPEGSDPLYLTVYNGALYFSADNGEGAGYELWKYDGTSSPSLAADIRSGPDSSGLSDFGVYDGALYFMAIREDGSGYALWKYDGTDAMPVVDLGYDVGYLAVYNGALYFSADGGDGTGVQLWRYNSP